MTMRLAWVNLTCGDANGYGIAGREMAKATLAAARQSGAEVTSEFGLGWEAMVMFGLPQVWPFYQGQQRPDLIWHTMCEVEPLPPGWVALLNRCGLVWAPSRWVADLFRRQGVRTPVVVAGYGVDPNVFWSKGSTLRQAQGGEEQGARSRKEGGPMRFGVWVDALRTRKHAELAVEAWLAADVPEATLEVKLADQTAPPFWVDGKGYPHHEIKVFRGAWAPAKVAEWLRSLDCLIYLSGGEGFGLMPLEAMACGTPVICAYNTGMMDYLTADNAILVKGHKPEAAPTYTARFGAEYQPVQLRPDFDEAVAGIRWASANRDGELLAIGQRAAEDAGRWTWEEAGRKAWDVLRTPYSVMRDAEVLRVSCSVMWAAADGGDVRMDKLALGREEWWR